MTRHLFRAVAAVVLAIATAVPAAAQVSWTDWTSANLATGTAAGTVTVGSTAVSVTYSGGFLFTQTSCGINYFTPNVYTSVAVPTAPTPCDIIAINTGGLKTITFSQPVVNPVFALVSWNGQSNVSFSHAIAVMSQGTGYWGTGTLSVTGSGNNVLVASGEAHGTIRVLGTVSSVSFTDVSENWHGLTVGVQGLPVTPVPEPATLALLANGLVALALIARRRSARAA
jgi:hypothetical protein